MAFIDMDVINFYEPPLSKAVSRGKELFPVSNNAFAATKQYRRLQDQSLTQISEPSSPSLNEPSEYSIPDTDTENYLNHLLQDELIRLDGRTSSEANPDLPNLDKLVSDPLKVQELFRATESTAIGPEGKSPHS